MWCGLGNPGLSSIQGGNWLDCVPLMAYRVQGSRPVVDSNAQYTPILCDEHEFKLKSSD